MVKSLGCAHCRNQITADYCSMGRNMSKGGECKLFKKKLPKIIKPEKVIIEKHIEQIEIEDYRPCRRCDYRNSHPHYQNQPCPKQDINGHSCFNNLTRTPFLKKISGEAQIQRS